jgi:GTPase SAR1 family protein
MTEKHEFPSLLGEALPTDLSRLKAYTKNKQAIARQVKNLRQYCTNRKDEPSASDCQDLIIKLAEDRFTLAVLGQFKRGKSSLMNAIIGRELLPTGVLPLTSAITVLRYGPDEKLIISREGALIPEEIPVGRLAEYVTEQSNPGNRKGVKTARLELPVPFLRHGLEFVDTPGVGSSIEANTITAYQFLPQCDAVLFVTSVEAPLTRAEVEFLTSIHDYVRGIFFVANKTDLLGDGEKQQILSFASDTLGKFSSSGPVRIFPVSARLGLEAKLQQDVDAYERSGLKALEEALAVYLANEKTTSFLRAVVDKARRVAERLRQNSQDADHEDTRRLQRLEEQLEALRSRLDGSSERPLADEPAPVEARNEAAAESSIEAAATGSTTLDVTPRTRECPLCRRLEQHALGLFSKWQYALASDAEAQAAFAARLGFCPLHTWQLVAISSPMSLSMGYPLLLDRVSRELAAAAHTASANLPTAITESARCRVCEDLRTVETRAVSELAEIVQDERGRRTYIASQGPCLRHLGFLLAAMPDPQRRRELLLHASNRMEEWSEEMQNYAMKRDALRRALLNRAEEDAYLRAIAHLVGTKSLCSPWNLDREF